MESDSICCLGAVERRSTHEAFVDVFEAIGDPRGHQEVVQARLQVFGSPPHRQSMPAGYDEQRVISSTEEPR
jgi:hypothetical protein